MSAEIIPFPERGRQPDCRLCEHSISGDGGTFCTVFREEILLEGEAAKDCGHYVEDPGRK